MCDSECQWTSGVTAPNSPEIGQSNSVTKCVNTPIRPMLFKQYMLFILPIQTE